MGALIRVDFAGRGGVARSAAEEPFSAGAATPDAQPVADEPAWHDADPHVAWLAEHDKLCASTSAGLDDEEFDAFCGRLCDLRDLAAATPGRALASARAMLRMAIAAGDDADDSRVAALVRNALATLDGLAVEGRHA